MGAQQKMVKELEITLWKTYSGSKAAHDEWKQNDKQPHGLLKLSFAKYKLSQGRPERAIHGCLILIFSFYSSSGFYQGILSPHVPAICTRFPACIRTQAEKEKLTTAWTSEISCSVGTDKLNVAYADRFSAYEHPPLTQSLRFWFVTSTMGNNLFLTRNWWILPSRVEGRWMLLRFDELVKSTKVNWNSQSEKQRRPEIWDGWYSGKL